MKRILVFLCAVLLALLPLGTAQAVVQPNDLFYVYDGAHVLDDDTIATIVCNNDALYAACGAQIVFVTIDSAGSMQLEDYAYKLFEEWGIGSAQKNNGVLVLLEIGAEDYWYMQGSGIERNLSTARLFELVDAYLEPDFAKGDYDRGVEKLFKALLAEVSDIYDANVSYRSYRHEDLYPQRGASSSSNHAGVVTTNRTGRSFSLIGGLFSVIGGLFRGLFVLVLIIILVVVLGSRSRRRRRTTFVSGTARHRAGGPRVHVSHTPYRSSSSYRSRSFGGSSRSSGGGRSGGFGGGRSFSGGSRSTSRPSGGSRMGGGGGTRGGGGGRGR